MNDYPFQRAIEFAASVNAKVTLPTEPRRPLSFYEQTSVKRTWDRFRPEPDFITGLPMVERRAS